MRRVCLIVVLCYCAIAARADTTAGDAFPLRNHNPFLQIYGVPAFRSAGLVDGPGMHFELGVDISNDMDDAARDREELVIDSETRTIRLALRRRIGQRFELGAELPYVRHSAGVFDSVIYDFHKFLGLSNATREGPQDRFRLLFARDGVTLFDMHEPVSGLGDLQLTGALQLGSITLRTSVKLPTGDPDKLTGSGALDVAAGAYAGGQRRLLDRALGYSGFVGVLALGQGDVLGDLQRSVVPYAGAAQRWQLAPRLALATQLYVQGHYFDIDLDELGGTTFQLACGLDFDFPRQKLLLRAAIIEDVAAAAAPDFALHLSVLRYAL